MILAAVVPMKWSDPGAWSVLLIMFVAVII